MTTFAAAVSVSTPVGGQSAGLNRAIDTVGTKRVAHFKITAAAGTTTYATGGFAFDPRKYGFDKPVARVIVVTEPDLVANVAVLRYRGSYDYVNKAILVFDTTDADEPNGDDISHVVFNVEVWSE